MKVLLLDTNHPLLQKGLENLGCICDEDYVSDKEMIEEKIHNYEGIIIRSRFSIDKNFLNKATNLKFIGRVGAGLENIDIAYAEKKDIHLISAPEGNRNAVGEHALGMLLSLFNKLNKADQEVRQGKWQREDNRGLELDGKTVGLIGYGNMGKAFAKKLRGFDIKVLCYDIKPNLGDENCKQVSLEELRSKADVLSLHTPETPLTVNMVDANFISAFTKPFWLLNTARGKSVVTKDLVEAIKSGKILGAGLDVLEYEKASFENLFKTSQTEQSHLERPEKFGREVSEKGLDSARPDIKLYNLPKAFEYLIASDKVLLSPHVAGWTIESKQKLAQTIVDKVKSKFY